MQPKQTMRYLEPGQNLEPGFGRQLSFRRDFGSFQSTNQPHRLPEISRNYLAGDPIRFIDWRAYARTDQLVINQKKQTAAAKVVIAVSCAPSMSWPSSTLHQYAVPKLEIALRVAMHLAFTHIKMLDTVTLCLVASEFYTRKIARASEVLEMYHTCCRDTFSQSKLISTCSFSSSSRQLPAEVKYWVGDGLTTSYANFFSPPSFCCFFHTLSIYELKSVWLDNDTSYFDQQQEALGRNFKSTFRKQIKTWLAEKERYMERIAGRYLLLTEDSTIDAYLHFARNYLRFAQ